MSTATEEDKEDKSHPGCPTCGDEAGCAALSSDTCWTRFRNRDFQPTRALSDVSTAADVRAQRGKESCSSTDKAHTETDIGPEEPEMRCCWH